MNAPPPREKFQHDPEGRRKRILDAAIAEFARHGFGGANMDRIARAADANKRSVYYHHGDKQALYLAVLEESYRRIRNAENELSLAQTDPREAIRRLVDFTWTYFLEHPEFISILNTENMQDAQFARESERIKSLHSPFLSTIGEVLERGAREGAFREGIDPVQLYISIAGLAWFYLSNSATLSVIFGRDLRGEEAKTARLDHMTDFVLRALRPDAANGG